MNKTEKTSGQRKEVLKNLVALMKTKNNRFFYEVNHYTTSVKLSCPTSWIDDDYNKESFIGTITINKNGRKIELGIFENNYQSFTSYEIYINSQESMYYSGYDKKFN